MNKKDRKKCTQLTKGKVISIKKRGMDFPVVVTVEYNVLGISYQISETKKYKSELIKIGFLPIGQKKIPKLGGVTVGDTVNVSYNSECPSIAYLTDNIGIITA